MPRTVSLIGALANDTRSRAQGIYSAIPNTLGGAVDAVKGAVDGIIDYIDPESPSRLFLPVGETIPWALSAGIENRLPGLSASVRAMGDALPIGSVPGSVAGTRSPALSAAGGGSRLAGVHAVGGVGVTYILQGNIIGSDVERWINDTVASGQAKRIDRAVGRSRIAESFG